ncbi:hypothetical protein GWO43_26125 [candidate division KSB1 bacterium]|nr:hypothetical protein [candidate division KSB1 bacterium]NIV70238.1 hypothetical protein [Phycisphaerae bacterium]NIR71126.1 hypothetical protein [candidate division KSB1 bacterium]NIS26142.1 hypothetical protein [candidate division KSB1 bacterium]NIT74288.1 hypothetical protein [candidate division KSB1 bacterium]
MGTSNYLQATIWKKSLLLSVVAVCALVLVLSSAEQIVGQEEQITSANQDSAQVQNEAGSTPLVRDFSVWEILRMTDWLFWPFVALTAGGLMLLIFRTLVEFQEKKRSEMLYAEIVQLRDMRSLLQAIQNSASNRAARLFRQTVFTFNKTGRAEPIRDDANQFLSAERNSFETFNRVVNFLSDTAGALGLLGTVWGIFATFHSGRLDGPTILQGMSVSLVTTLVGLIISSILNMGATAVFAIFNKQLNLLSSRAEQVRQALLNIEKRTQAQAPVSPPDMQQQDGQDDQPEPEPTIVPEPASSDLPVANNGDNMEDNMEFPGGG